MKYLQSAQDGGGGTPGQSLVDCSGFFSTREWINEHVQADAPGDPGAGSVLRSTVGPPGLRETTFPQETKSTKNVVVTAVLLEKRKVHSHLKAQNCGHKPQLFAGDCDARKTRHDSELLDSLRASLSDLQSERLVSSNEPQLVALKRDIRQAIHALEHSPQPTVKMTVEMRWRATEMRKQAHEMRKRAAQYRAHAKKHLPRGHQTKRDSGGVR